jgi:hypothetical protein
VPIDAQSWIGSLPLTTPPRWSGENSPPHTTFLGIDRAAKSRALQAGFDRACSSARPISKCHLAGPNI